MPVFQVNLNIDFCSIPEIIPAIRTRYDIDSTPAQQFWLYCLLGKNNFYAVSITTDSLPHHKRTYIKLIFKDLN